MASPTVTVTGLLCLFAFGQLAQAQQSLSSVNADGMALAQLDPAIERSRLYQESAPIVPPGVDANGMALAEAEPTDPKDDSFGAQQILKSQEKIPTFEISASASVLYTSNVALVRRDPKDDVLGVVETSASWSPKLGKDLELNFGLHASLFRYHNTPALDFENLGAGLGLAWSPPALRGAGFFAHYDFTELIARGGHQILQDHSITVGLQRVFALGRSHAFTAGFLGTVDLSDPSAAQRSLLGGFVAYHLSVTRKLGADLLYRPSVQFYTDADRTDLNQVASLSLHYRLSDWAEVNASFSYGNNRSDHSVFDYDVGTIGGTTGLNLRF